MFFMFYVIHSVSPSSLSAAAILQLLSIPACSRSCCICRILATGHPSSGHQRSHAGHISLKKGDAGHRPRNARDIHVFCLSLWWFFNTVLWSYNFFTLFRTYLVHLFCHTFSTYYGLVFRTFLISFFLTTLFLWLVFRSGTEYEFKMKLFPILML